MPENYHEDCDDADELIDALTKEVERLTLLKDALVGDKNRLKVEVEGLRGDVEHLQDALAVVNASDVLRLRRIEGAASTVRAAYDDSIGKVRLEAAMQDLRAALADQRTEGHDCGKMGCLQDEHYRPREEA